MKPCLLGRRLATPNLREGDPSARNGASCEDESTLPCIVDRQSATPVIQLEHEPARTPASERAATFHETQNRKTQNPRQPGEGPVSIILYEPLTPGDQRARRAVHNSPARWANHASRHARPGAPPWVTAGGRGEGDRQTTWPSGPASHSHGALRVVHLTRKEYGVSYKDHSGSQRTPGGAGQAGGSRTGGGLWWIRPQTGPTCACSLRALPAFDGAQWRPEGSRAAQRPMRAL